MIEQQNEPGEDGGSPRSCMKSDWPKGRHGSRAILVRTFSALITDLNRLGATYALAGVGLQRPAGTSSH